MSTATCNPAAPRAACPRWCNGEHTPGIDSDRTPVHMSNPRVWEGDSTHDTPTYAVEFYRGDEWFDGELIIGLADMSVTIAGGYDVDTDDAGRVALHGNLTANDARNFARWLSDQAREIDPHHTNGAPPRVPHQGCSCGTGDD